LASSGTYLFAPSQADFVVQAYGRCGVKRTELEAEHMVDAGIAANLLLEEWSNDQPRLWKVDLYPLALTTPTATYTLPAETILPLSIYISTTLSGVTTDRILNPISAEDYAAYPNKGNLSRPSVYWFDRLIIPTITFYQTPDVNTYTANILRVKHIQDANAVMGQTPDLPRRFRPAFVSGLAARLAETYAPDRYDALEKRHVERLAKATSQDQENADLRITPDLSGYFR
jgi:hypothetical protein